VAGFRFVEPVAELVLIKPFNACVKFVKPVVPELVEFEFLPKALERTPEIALANSWLRELPGVVLANLALKAVNVGSVCSTAVFRPANCEPSSPRA